MKKLALYISLAYCLLNFAAVASVTTDLLALRAARNADVTPGVWHADLNKARAYAETNGLPLVAVWSNGEYCTRCVQFENCVMSPAFQNWMKDSGIVFYFGVSGDNTSDGQEGYHGTSFYWCCNNQNASMVWPYVRVWWPEGDVDECHSGSWYDGEDGDKILRCNYSDNRTDPDNFIYPGDYGTYNPGGRRIISVLVGNAAASAAMPEGGMVTGGLLAKKNKSIVTVDDYDWSFYPKDNYVVIYGGRAIAAVSPPPEGSVDIPVMLGGKPVMGIGDWAFSECFELTGVTIPAGVTSIGNWAFNECIGLTGVTLPAGVTSIGNWTFNECFSLTDVTIPAGVTSIGDWAFNECFSLTSVTIPAGLTSIGDGAFANCASLSDVAFAGDMDAIDIDVFSAFEGTPWLESYIASLPPEDPDANTEDVGGYTWRYRINGDGAEIYGTQRWFSTWDPLNEMYVMGYSCTPAVSPKPIGFVEVPDALGGYPVTRITEGAFFGCGGMTGIGFPDGLEIIGYSAFENCCALECLEIPDSVVGVWGRAFSSCSALTNVVIGSGVEEINPYAFAGCGRLTRFEVAVGNPSYKSVGGMLLTKDGETLVKGVNGEVEVPAGVTEIGEGAFCGYGGLTGVRLPEGVEVIGDEAFEDCRALTFVEIPDSLTRIGSWAFDGCGDALFDTVTVPGARLVDGWAVGSTESLSAFLDLSGARGVGDYAFECCNALKYVEIPTNMTGVGNYAFCECEGLKFVGLPDGMKSIGEGVFEDCCSLEAISIPASVERIEWGAFYGCENLSSVTFKGDMDAIDMDVFSAFEGTPWLESYIAALPRPVNDDFTNATVIAGTSGSVTGSNVAATFEENEPYDYGDHGTVWWRWTAPASGTAVFDTRDSGFNANTAVFTGDKLSELEEIAINGDRQSRSCYAYTSRIEFEAKKGVTYSIAVGGYEYGAIVLEWEMEPAEGSCIGKAMALRPSQEITLVNEYDEENSEFLDDGVCCFKVTLIRGRAYTIGISGGDVADMVLSVDADYDDENSPLAAFDIENDDTNGIITAYLEADSWEDDDPSQATFYVCVRGEVGQGTTLYFSRGIQKLPAVVKSDDGKTVAVPTTWLEVQTERAVTDTAANGRKVWECYVLGLDPENPASDFKIVSLPMKADGTPDLENIVFEPTPDEWNMPAAQPVLKGAATLEGPWETVQDGNESAFRFFKVVVELP